MATANVSRLYPTEFFTFEIYYPAILTGIQTSTALSALYKLPFNSLPQL